jgi:hypothetical protein
MAEVIALGITHNSWNGKVLLLAVIEELQKPSQHP